MDTPNFDSSKIIRLVGHIDEEASENFLSELRETSLTGVEGGLTVVIHSEGGDPEDSMRILDAFQMLKNKGFRIHTIATGKAYSMAAILFCMGDYRTIYPNGRLMFHASRFPELQDYDVTGAKLMDLYNELKVYDFEHRKKLDMFSVYLDEFGAVKYVEFTKVEFDQATKKFNQNVHRYENDKYLKKFLG
jgi:hypothetical protein